ncbi:MAG: CBS domain-containing protein [Cytophagales bacterium]|nr:CBS domain-containing protein [Rhizobacter sp.]
MQKISEVITRHVVVVRPDENLQRAAELMSQLNVGSLPVYDGRSLVGIITDRDITVRATAFNKSPAGTLVSETMTAQTESCAEDDSVEDVLKQMGDAQVRRLPVLNRAKEIVGIVSLGDLATRQPVQTGPALREISQPSDSQTQLA